MKEWIVGAIKSRTMWVSAITIAIGIATQVAGESELSVLARKWGLIAAGVLGAVLRAITSTPLKPPPSPIE